MEASIDFGKEMWHIKTFIVRSREDMVFGGLAIGVRDPDIAHAVNGALLFLPVGSFENISHVQHTDFETQPPVSLSLRP
jgi:hypothetical protein